MSRSLREGLDEELLVIFDLLRKAGLNSGDIKNIKAISVLSIYRSRVNRSADRFSSIVTWGYWRIELLLS